MSSHALRAYRSLEADLWRIRAENRDDTEILDAMDVAHRALSPSDRRFLNASDPTWPTSGVTCEDGVWMVTCVDCLTTPNNPG